LSIDGGDIEARDGGQVKYTRREIPQRLDGRDAILCP
jgi:hypothetical protein